MRFGFPAEGIFRSAVITALASASLFFPIFLDIFDRKLIQMGGIDEADLFSLFLGRFNRHSIAQDATDHPECSDTDRRRTVNERRAVLFVVCNPQELSRLFFFG